MGIRIYGNGQTHSSREKSNNAPAAATIEADSITVAAGQTVVVQAIVKDKDGKVLPDIPLEGNSDIGTYDKGKFIAGSKAGSGTLTLRAGEIQTNAAVTVTEAVPTLEPVAGNTSSKRKRNRETVLQPIPNQANKEGDTVSFQAHGTGDGPLSYAAEGLPGGIMIDGQTGLISGKIGYKTVTPTPIGNSGDIQQYYSYGYGRERSIHSSL